MSAHGGTRTFDSCALKRRRTAIVALTLLTSMFAGCGHAPDTRLAAPVTEGPEDAILRVASDWEARHTEKGLRSSPSPIASFDRQVVSRLVLVRGEVTATESTTFTERFVLRDGGEARCSGGAVAEVAVAYGRKAGEPVIELAWPAQPQQRDCDTPGVPIPEVERPAGRSRFVLRSDQLVGVEPARERRSFLPAD